MIDKQEAPVIGRTLSCHASDLSPLTRELLTGFWRQEWPCYMVHFPDHSKVIPLSYLTLDEKKLAESLLKGGENQEFLAASEVVSLEGSVVSLKSGRQLRGAQIIDTTAQEMVYSHMGFQKFFGLELVFEEPHGLKFPIVMDARVEQTDGFRFFYALPYSERRLLLEDTYLSASPHLNQKIAQQAIEAYAESFDIPYKVVDHEQGVLPVPYRRRKRSSNTSALCLGAQAGLFNPATGYSFAAASQILDAINADFAKRRESGVFFVETLNVKKSLEHRTLLYYIYNFFLFECFRPRDAFHCFDYFYNHSLGYVRRFYGLRFRVLDLCKLFVQPPPKRIRLSQIPSRLYRVYGTFRPLPSKLRSV